MQGLRGDHVELRARIVGFITQQRDFFENFVEDDEEFDHYIARIAEARAALLPSLIAGLAVPIESCCIAAETPQYQAEGADCMHTMEWPRRGEGGRTILRVTGRYQSSKADIKTWQ